MRQILRSAVLIIALGSQSRVDAQGLQDITFTNQILTLSNLQGVVYENAQVARADSEGLIYRLDGGSGGRIPYTNLPMAIIEKLGIPTNRVEIARSRAERRNFKNSKFGPNDSPNAQPIFASNSPKVPVQGRVVGVNASQIVVSNSVKVALRDGVTVTKINGVVQTIGGGIIGYGDQPVYTYLQYYPAWTQVKVGDIINLSSAYCYLVADGGGTKTVAYWKPEANPMQLTQKVWGDSDSGLRASKRDERRGRAVSLAEQPKRAALETESGLSLAEAGEPSNAEKVKILSKIVADFHSQHTYIATTTREDIFVCGDMANEVWNIVQTRGFKAKIQIGNVDRKIGTLLDANHAWVLLSLVR